jgi:Tol biopolymer transport system component
MVSDWSSEGILYGERPSSTEEHIWLWPTGGGEPVPLVISPFLNYGGRLSPDGRWLAFASNETGTDEVYVQAFPDARGKVRISHADGSSPVWGGDGEELFFSTPEGTLMAVSVLASTGEFASEAPRPLFNLQSMSGFQSASLWAPLDAERFVVLRRATESRNVELTFNWQALLDD